jgi:hypothetical protein
MLCIDKACFLPQKDIENILIQIKVEEQKIK